MKENKSNHKAASKVWGVIFLLGFIAQFYVAFTVSNGLLAVATTILYIFVVMTASSAILCGFRREQYKAAVDKHFGTK